MKPRTYIVFCIVVFLAGAALARETRTDSLMDVLERVISERPAILAAKEADIAELRRRCELSTTDTALFYALGDLFDGYHRYNADSALAVSVRREAQARRIGSDEFIMTALMNQVDVLAVTGMFREAVQIIESIDPSRVPASLKPYYYYLDRTVYDYMSDFSASPVARKRYSEYVDIYRDSLLHENKPGTLAYVLHETGRYSAAGRWDSAVSLLGAYTDTAALCDHDRAICAWTMAEAYGIMGDTAAMQEQLLISSIGDLRSATREYVSLRHLAMLLYRKGDLERAHRLMNIAITDAQDCNARLRTLELNDFYPEINAIYIGKIKSQQRAQRWLIILISCLVLVLVYVLVRLRGKMMELRRSRCEVAQKNVELGALNGSLQTTNRQLAEANRAIAENSRLKEVYIGNYMDQCVAYIEKKEKYRKALLKLEAAGKRDELRQAIRNTGTMDEELRSFYQSFDATFLNLFPTFVGDFNALLQPGEEIVPKKEGTLTTELRIFALIRLGITDSDRIAKFLGYSLTTIYNYRTRVRNKSRGDRARLEAEVLKIGQPDG